MIWSLSAASMPLLLALLLGVAVTKSYGGCSFPTAWTGSWFQSGLPTLHVNRTTIETKGECYDAQGDKFVVWDRADDCYRCMVIHKKHAAVLQYKETYCVQKAELHELCYGITGDAALYSMFRKNPMPPSVPCPFKPAPFTFSYSRGSGECVNPPSRAESCTDDSRLVLKYQACPDIESSESNIEELVCVATWKEGSTRYLVGRVSQINRRSPAPSDEDQYRCFIYERVATPSSSKITYHVAQSGDATCNGLQSALEGSRTMKLSTADTHHGKCRFPAWVTDHHTWVSLNHSRVFKFSLRNATLKIFSEDTHSEIRVVCHSILQAQENRRVQIVAHVTAGCDSGYMCLMLHKRDSAVIEVQQSEGLVENPDDACRYFDYQTPYTTLIAPTLHPMKCPHAGRYSVLSQDVAAADRKRRKKRENSSGLIEESTEQPTDPLISDCHWEDHNSLVIGCTNSDILEFYSRCAQQTTAYTCHGSWQENGTYYVIAAPVARRSTDPLRYCIALSFDAQPTPALPRPNAADQAAVDTEETPHLMRLSGLADSCHRFVQPGRDGLWKFNFTTNGSCTRSGDTSTASTSLQPSQISFLMVAVLAARRALRPGR